MNAGWQSRATTALLGAGAAAHLCLDLGKLSSAGAIPLPRLGWLPAAQQQPRGHSTARPAALSTDTGGFSLPAHAPAWCEEVQVLTCTAMSFKVPSKPFSDFMSSLGVV